MFSIFLWKLPISLLEHSPIKLLNYLIFMCRIWNSIHSYNETYTSNTLREFNYFANYTDFNIFGMKKSLFFKYKCKYLITDNKLFDVTKKLVLFNDIFIIVFKFSNKWIIK